MSTNRMIERLQQGALLRDLAPDLMSPEDLYSEGDNWANKTLWKFQHRLLSMEPRRVLYSLPNKDVLVIKPDVVLTFSLGSHTANDHRFYLSCFTHFRDPSNHLFREHAKLRAQIATARVMRQDIGKDPNHIPFPTPPQDRLECVFESLDSNTNELRFYRKDFSDPVRIQNLASFVVSLEEHTPPWNHHPNESGYIALNNSHQQGIEDLYSMFDTISSDDWEIFE